MQLIRVVVTAVALAIVSAAPVFPEEANWSAFKLAHGRQFSSAADESARFQIYRDNVQYILEENSKNHSYTLGITRFADMTTQEFEDRYFPEPGSQHNNASLAPAGLHQWASGEELPASVDWQAAGATNPIQDENENGCYGACYAFAAAGAIEGAFKIKTGKLRAISEQQLVDCSSGFGNHGCQGGLMNYAYNYAMQTDLCTLQSYPYYGPTRGACHSQCQDIGIPRGTITDIKRVNSDEQSLMSAVAQQPVSVGLDGAWADTNAFRFYRSGVLSASCGSRVDHGVLVVGYGTDVTQGAYWKIRNSYGTSWGMEGYALLARGKGGSGECGLLSSSMSYPVM